MLWLRLVGLLLVIPIANAVVINEIMYNPDKCADSSCEWVELYNPAAEEVNITYWRIDGKNISVATMPANSYLVIARNRASFLANYSTSCTAIQTAIILDNGGETLYLSNSDGDLIDSATYNNTLGGDGNDKTLSLADSMWRESLQADGTPCQPNFLEHDINLSLKQKGTNEITAHLENNGLSDENITLDLFIDGNISETSELALASFDFGDVTFVAENISIGWHVVLINATFSGNSVSAELNFTNELPNADVYLTININQSISDYSVYSYPENASLSVDVFTLPIGLDDADSMTSDYDISAENNLIDAYSDIIDPEVDFGTYDLCTEITAIHNYNDTNLENNFVCANFTIAPPASQTRLRAKTFTNYEKYNLNQILSWAAQIFPLESGAIGNLTISLQKKTSRNSIELLWIENLNLTEIAILSGNFTIPEDWIEGIYKIRAKFKYSEKYFDSRDSGQFWLNGLKDLGEANITILQTPNVLKFGGFGTTVVKFFAGNNNYEKLRFLVYGFPSQVLMDLDGKGVTASSADASVAVEIQNVKRGESYYLALPEFAKQNCDSNYKSDEYRIRVRAFKPAGSGWEELTTADYQLPFKEKISAFCPEAPKKERVSLAGLQLQKQRAVSDVIDISISGVPEQVAAGDSFTLDVELQNKMNMTKKVQIYSYIYSGHSIITEGGWTGNAQVVELDSLTSKKILLDNLVKEDAPVGKYILRVRAKVDGREVDLDSEVEIIAPEQTAEETLSVGGAGPSAITGAAVLWKSEQAGNLSVAAMAVIAILLILVVVLIKAHR